MSSREEDIRFLKSKIRNLEDIIRENRGLLPDRNIEELENQLSGLYERLRWVERGD